MILLETEARIEADGDRRLGHALTALDGAVRLAPTDAGLRIFRARILMRLNKLAEARNDLASILRLNPSHADARRMLDDLSRREQQRQNPQNREPHKDEAPLEVGHDP